MNKNEYHIMNFSRIAPRLITIVMLGLATWLPAASSHAHEINPAVVIITVNDDEASINITFNAEIFLAGIDASTIRNTNETAQAEEYDRLRALDTDMLEDRLSQRQDDLLAMIMLQSDGQALALTMQEIDSKRNTDLTTPRMTTVTARADLPSGGAPVQLRLAPDLGAYIIRQKADAGSTAQDEELYADFIAAGLETLPIPRTASVERTWQATFVQYIISGIAHIIPKGLDHIVFIMGLYFFSPRLRPLLMQVTVFTLAHSVTLAMATLKLIYIPASVVEPLIALSIAWIGVENILRPKIGASRLTVIFVFGLLHGLGFAFVLGEVGLAGSAFAVSLIAFNIGVEVGQLLVLAPLVVMGAFISHRKDYRKHVENPASLLIALIGMYWFLERVIG